jgi:NAD+ synthase (glutamine-hydrolysing)
MKTGTGPIVALAQINPTVGAIEANARLISEWIARARAEGADLVLFPELCLPGYPAEDLYLKRHFLEANARALEALAREADGIAVLVGFAEPRLASTAPHEHDAPAPRAAHNSLALLRDGRVDLIYRKQRLPNYAVFDERRYFEPGTEPGVVEIAGVRVGLTICEDLWEPGPPASTEAEEGATLIVCPSGSPYYRGKRADREAMFARRANAYGPAFAFCNLVGGQDELVFDGASFVVDAGGEVVARAKQFEEDLLIWELGGPPARIEPPLSDLDEVYSALVVGLRDYVAKNGFDRVLVAVSGGIDSALVAMLAADALGGDRVTGVVMPSPHSSQETQDDARAIVRNIGARLVEIPISSAMSAYDAALDGSLEGGETDLALENLQARIRGNLMMALSNAHGWLVLTTGNKSEM